MAVEVEASQVLAAALEQMDGIIAAGTKLEETTSEVPALLRKLHQAVENRNETLNYNWESLNLDSASSIFTWLQQVLDRFGVEREETLEELKEKVRCLEKDKENLLLQVSVLTSQVDLQNEKIEELEKNSENGRDCLRHMEEMLRQESEARVAADSSRMDLLSELSSLRSQLALVRQEAEERIKKIQSDLVVAQTRLLEKETELVTLRTKRALNGLSSSPIIQPSSSIISDKGVEMDTLRHTVDSLMIANHEKDKAIEELRRSLLKQKQLQKESALMYPRKGLALNGNSRTISEDSLLPPSPAGNQMKMFEDMEPALADKPPTVPRTLPLSPSNWSAMSPIHRASSAENVLPLLSPTKTPPMSKRNYVTIPRQHSSQFLRQIQEHSESPHPSSSTPSSPSQPLSSRKPSSGVSFGKGFFRLRKGLFTSAPDLALQPDSPVRYTPSSSPRSFSSTEKPKGILKFFEKLKRAGSTNLNPIEASSFKRGGLRSTTGPRTGHSYSLDINPDLPFTKWTTELVCDWLLRQGLGTYVPRAQMWIKSGQQLMQAAPATLEKELGIKHPLHLKKLVLHLQKLGGKLSSAPRGYMDNPWVIRWLDDIGLPQYKEVFMDARLDGLVLHFLSVENLFSHMKISNHLHFLSLRRGIHLLRHVNYEPRALCRRSQPNEDKSQYGPREVVYWTNHRVMEWLRTVDLAEYAPNLRGSGVHGALMVLEPRFTAEVLASLLNIPSSKTLLRRHLTTQFRHLVGKTLMVQKREWEAQDPLLPSARIKPIRKSNFTLRRRGSRSKAEVDLEELVCPLTLDDVQLEDQRTSTEASQQLSASEESGGDTSSLSSLLQEDKSILANLEASTV